jgi:hypothetical protein
MWLIVLPLMFKLSPPVVSPRDPGSQSLDWGPVPHFCPWKHCSHVAYCTALNVQTLTTSRLPKRSWQSEYGLGSSSALLPPGSTAAMWLILLPLIFKLSPPVVSPRDPGSQSWIGVQFRNLPPGSTAASVAYARGLFFYLPPPHGVSAVTSLQW